MTRARAARPPLASARRPARGEADPQHGHRRPPTRRCCTLARPCQGATPRPLQGLTRPRERAVFRVGGRRWSEPRDDRESSRRDGAPGRRRRRAGESLRPTRPPRSRHDHRRVEATAEFAARSAPGTPPLEGLVARCPDTPGGAGLTRAVAAAVGAIDERSSSSSSTSTSDPSPWGGVFFRGGATMPSRRRACEAVRASPERAEAPECAGASKTLSRQARA